MNNKNLPIYIIVIVLITAVIGGIWLFRNNGTGKVPPGNATPATKNDDLKVALAKAPPGAQPAWSKGDPKAVVNLEEFADFACPTCGNFHQILKEIEKTYGQRVRITFRHFPLTAAKGHENAYNAARAAEAAGMQGRFWEMQNQIFTNQKTWQPMPEADAKTAFEGYAKAIGIDVEKFKQDMLGQVASARVGDDMKRASAIPVTSTPTVIINGERMLSYPEISNIQTLRQLIETELQKAAAPAAPANSNQNAQ
jgi:protein-disulfide isomerase